VGSRAGAHIRHAEANRAGSSGDATAAIPPEHSDQIVDRFNRGVSLMEQFKPVDAVAVLEEVVELAPDWTTGRLNLGIALLNAIQDVYLDDSITLA